ncbi:MAG: 4Fe-4S dicluster domain-containing protein [Bacteroidota bacterium]
MQFGFVIDNRKCIGCHACTTACKSEHQVPVGVNRTWVKQVEKGVFPDSRRLFSVMRCNHCTDAPCVEICPTEALYVRSDGIVDFNNDRCIGCKSCMQACPYDALYIDPENHTAAKCNYCAHRVDIGLEPACVNVCPEEAIISGDLQDPDSKIAKLLSRHPVKARKPEKGTSPNLFYIDGDDASLNPTETEKSEAYFWSSQARGVGHFAKAAEKMAFSNGDVLQTLMRQDAQETALEVKENGPKKSVEVILGKARRTYDAPDKGILWGWEVSAYVWTKAIAAGVMLVLLTGVLGDWVNWVIEIQWFSLGMALVFLTLTGLLLIKDLDRPDRFLYVLFRPHWGSWLVKGGYGITVFGGLLSLWGLTLYMGWTSLQNWILMATGLAAAFVAVYTAFLFAQAKGRDFWQSPTLSLHMLIHSFGAGAAVLLMADLVWELPPGEMAFLKLVLMGSILANLVVTGTELYTPHPTKDAKKVVDMITKGEYRTRFWGLVFLVGNLIPFTILVVGAPSAVAGLLVLLGIYMTELIWVEAPQRIPLS